MTLRLKLLSDLKSTLTDILLQTLTTPIDFWRQKTKVPGLSRGVVCVMLRLAVLIIQYRHVTDRHTDRHTDTRRRLPELAWRRAVKIAIYGQK